MKYANCIERFQNDESTFGFETPSREACKSLHKCCSQHLAFFRLVQMSQPSGNHGNNNSSNSNGKLLNFSGRTAATGRSPPQFRRTPSRRHQRRVVDGASHRKSLFFSFFFSVSKYSILNYLNFYQLNR